VWEVVEEGEGGEEEMSGEMPVKVEVWLTGVDTLRTPQMVRDLLDARFRVARLTAERLIEQKLGIRLEATDGR
jgi:hypothetical protein